MAKLIDADVLVGAIEDIDWFHVNAKGKLVDGANPANNIPIYRAFDIYNAIKNAPTVDAVEVVHGRWVHKGSWHIECSECKHVLVHIGEAKNYCPNCGAKMDGGAADG